VVEFESMMNVENENASKKQSGMRLIL
jgi:hypothetical protein